MDLPYNNKRLAYLRHLSMRAKNRRLHGTTLYRTPCICCAIIWSSQYMNVAPVCPGCRVPYGRTVYVKLQLEQETLMLAIFQDFFYTKFAVLFVIFFAFKCTVTLLYFSLQTKIIQYCTVFFFITYVSSLFFGCLTEVSALHIRIEITIYPVGF